MKNMNLEKISKCIEALSKKCEIMEEKYSKSNGEMKKTLLKKIHAIKFFALPQLRGRLDRI